MPMNYGGDPLALMKLCCNGVDHARDLIAQGINLDEREPGCQYTALMFAAKFGHIEIVRQLVQAGASLDLQAQGRNALQYVQQWDHTEIATILQQAAEQLEEET